MALTTEDAKAVVDKRHHEWCEHQLSWTFLLDSLEGGDRYRQATYGTDCRGYPIRNMVRHKHETIRRDTVPMGDSTALDPSHASENDDYELRRARTPVPTFVAEAVQTYVSTIFSCEINREAPEGSNYDRLRGWWADVDGRGTTMDEWMEDTVGPLLLTFGHLDLLFDHPMAPDGVNVRSKADATKLDLTRCVASHILPQNMVDWELNPDGTYRTCLYLERGVGKGDHETECSYRYWTAEESILLDGKGKILKTVPHKFGRVPIDRVFDSKKQRCQHIGHPRFGSTAERQREYYNRDSELILSDTIQAHPVTQGPEELVFGDKEIAIGPGNTLAMKGSGNGEKRVYQGWEVIDFPKGAAESLRANKSDIRDDVDRDAKLTKPAGVSGTSNGTVGQSGVSKELDHDGLHKQLTKVSKRFARAERAAAGMALAVLFDGAPPSSSDVKISYPMAFNLRSAKELVEILTGLQEVVSAAGEVPETETAMICDLIRKALPGRDDQTYTRLDAEVADTIEAKAKTRGMDAEGKAGRAFARSIA